MFARPTQRALSTISKSPYICQSCLRNTRKQQLSSGFSNSSQHRRSLQTATQTDDVVPFRKQLKDEAKKKRRQGDSSSSRKDLKVKDARLEKWELTVGIEIHAELNTARKLFSQAATSVNEIPNTHVAFFDVAFPGSQPHFQTETLLPALRAAIALQCNIQPRSTFDRKHYFYQDQPAGYQITQYYEPFARDGQITLYAHDGIAPEDGESITIGIKQIQMEQDTAKTVQQPPSTHLLDFNRVSHPLIEVITLPHIHHPATAAACVRKIQAILKQVNAVTAGMELGGLRADVNVSVRENHREYGPGEGLSYYGVGGLGQRTEIKNLASVKDVENAIVAEMNRQIDILENGGVIEGETRSWTLGSTETKKLRGKEGEVDYRYMPDPDIPPVIIGQNVLQHVKGSLPLLPDDITDMLVQSPKYGLTVKDAKTLVTMNDGDRLEYYFDVVDRLRAALKGEHQLAERAGKIAGNWVLMELGGLFGTEEWSATRVPSEQLASIILHTLRRQVTGRTAKALLATVFEGDSRSVEQIINDENLRLRPMSHEQYVAMAQDLIEENPDMVRIIKEKKQHGKIRWFVGQMIRRGDEGTIEAEAAELVLRELLQLSRQN